MSQKMKPIPMPECEKLKAISEKSQQIGFFIDWLKDTKKIVFAKKLQDFPLGSTFESEEVISGISRVYLPIEELIAEYFQIDLKKVDQERRALLEELQRIQIQETKR